MPTPIIDDVTPDSFSWPLGEDRTFTVDGDQFDPAATASLQDINARWSDPAITSNTGTQIVFTAHPIELLGTTDDEDAEGEGDEEGDDEEGDDDADHVGDRILGRLIVTITNPGPLSARSSPIRGIYPVEP